MSNFIEDLDERYRRERKKNRIKKEDKTFVCNIPLRVKLYGSINAVSYTHLTLPTIYSV